ncbi:hypothetical protein AMECASPLE_036270 [Ameca splendens]|uniref:Uncharacterized protein n=1 Tax=Ameca splendens TaxID=208324 RepID=A0ABV0YVM0_9TELE
MLHPRIEKNAALRALESQPEAAAMVRNSIVNSISGLFRCFSVHMWRLSIVGSDSEEKVNLNSWIKFSKELPNWLQSGNLTSAQRRALPVNSPKMNAGTG